ncbi:MAG: large repetitive protein [Chloroflexota bacterium]|jgi:uncharacterized repeat protein (TIGR01451 family)|nr:large repetitive protein [Chloroflexota bacterium]
MAGSQSRVARGALALLLVSAMAPLLQGCSLLPGPLALTVTQQDMTPESAPKTFKTVRVEVTNSDAGTARGLTVRDNLPSGFSFVSTKSVGGDAIRTRTSDPPVNSPAPLWAAWSLPGGTPDKPTKLTLDFVLSVSTTPARTPNFVEVTTDDTDPLSAKPIVFSVTPTALVDLSVATRSPVKPGETTHYVLTLSNKGTAAANGTFISAALPAGFIYAGTTELGGNSIRIGVTDPLPNSVAPTWGTWQMPGLEQGGAVGALRIGFDAKVVSGEAPGNYPISITVSYNDLPAQTVTDQAQVTVIK